jgi:enoyl-CoA hydratase
LNNVYEQEGTHVTETQSYIRVERHDKVALVRIDRPEARNALNTAVREQLADALEALDGDEAVRCMVLTGSPKAFVAGADLRELADLEAVDVLLRDQLRWWERLRHLRTPLIAAVNGYALGGGCELAMTCDMIVAGRGARFGQPEIKVGIMPGGGGTQRLVRAVGKARAMELLLTGRLVDADEAERMGLVTRVVPDEEVVDQALALAATIAEQPPVAARLIKDAASAALDVPLEAGLVHERHNFSLLFATRDQREGMAAFLEKRPPRFTGR